jgi:hypothetical protein
MSCVDFYPVDQFAFDFDFGLGEDLAPTHYLGDVSVASASSFLPDLISTADYDFFSMDTLGYQESAGLVPYDPMAFLQDTPGPVGIFPPLVTDYHYQPTTLEPFDGMFPTEDTCWEDIRRYMDKHGKPPFISAFSEEDVSLGRCVSIVVRLRIHRLRFYIHFRLLDVASVPSPTAFLLTFQLLPFESELLLFPIVYV